MENVYFQLQELMMTLLDVVKGEFEWCVPKTLKYICEHYQTTKVYPEDSQITKSGMWPRHTLTISYIMATRNPKFQYAHIHLAQNLLFSTLWSVGKPVRCYRHSGGVPAPQAFCVFHLVAKFPQKFLNRGKVLHHESSCAARKIIDEFTSPCPSLF